MTLEVVVRPAVLPNIRPSKPRTLPVSSDNPDQGMVVLGGGGPTFVGTSYSYSYSETHSKPHKEKKRQVDTIRVYQTDPQTGDVIEENYVDVDVTKKILLLGGKEPQKINYGEHYDPEKNKNQKMLERQKTMWPVGSVRTD